MIGELYPGEFEAMEHNGRMDALEQEPCEDSDMKLIHTQGLDEGIKCAMCTNSMANDKGCDGGCVVNEVMYKKILDVIRRHIIDGDEKGKEISMGNIYDNNLISRQAVLQQINCWIGSGEYRYAMAERFLIDRIKELPPVNAQPYEDAISREATLKPYKDLNDEDTISVWLIRKNIEQQPPVTPQPKTGHWIRVDKDKLRCSKCDVIHFIGQYPQGKIAWCPNCGARMIEPQESEDKE